MDSITELLLLEASRAQFTVQKVMPLLREGGIIVSGRYFDSTTAYQGYGNGTHLWDVNYLNKLSTQGLEPDMTFLLDIDTSLAMKKIVAEDFKTKDRFEQKEIDFFNRVRRGYLEIANRNSDRIKVIKYKEGDAEGMHKEIIEHLKTLLDIKSPFLAKDDKTRYKQFGIEQFS